MQSGVGEALPLPKVPKMPTPKEHRKAEEATTPANSPPREHFKEDDPSGLRIVTRWVNLADQVLGNRRKAES